MYQPVYVRPRVLPGRLGYTEPRQEDREMATTNVPPRADGRVVGRVSDIKREKGFAFVVDNETGLDYFFHRSECPEWAELQQYDTVVFKAGEGPKGRRATQVERE